MDIKTKLHNTQKSDNNLIVIHKTKTTLTLNKPEYIRMRILKLNKV